MLKINLIDLYRNIEQKGGSNTTDYEIRDTLSQDFTGSLNFNENKYFCIRKKNNISNLENLGNVINYNNKNYNLYSLLSESDANEIKKNLNLEYIKIKFESNCNNNILKCGDYLFYTTNDTLPQLTRMNDYEIIYELKNEENRYYISFKEDNNEEIGELQKDNIIIKSTESLVNCTEGNKLISDIYNFRKVLYSQAKLKSTINWKFYKGKIENGKIIYGDECLKVDDLKKYNIFLSN